MSITNFFQDFNPITRESIPRNSGTITINGTTSPFEDFRGNGRMISKRTAQNMVGRDVFKSSSTKPNHSVAVEFDAYPILLILSQPDCIGIRFYAAKKTDGVGTLVCIGYDKNFNDLNAPASPNGKIGSIICDPESRDIERSVIIEVGGGNLLNDFPEYMEVNN